MFFLRKRARKKTKLGLWVLGLGSWSRTTVQDPDPKGLKGVDGLLRVAKGTESHNRYHRFRV